MPGKKEVSREDDFPCGMRETSMTRKRSGTGLLALAAVFTLASCGSPSIPQSTPTPTVAASIPSAPQKKRLELSPAQTAWEYAEQGRIRLSYIAEANEGNGYERLTAIKKTPGGLLEMAERAKQRGVPAIFAELDLPEGEEDSPFRKDYVLVLRAASHRHVGAPLKVPDRGPVAVPGSEAFIAACSALWLLPALEVENPDVEDQLQSFRTYLHLARAICLDAATVEHYEQGNAFERQTLEPLARVVRNGKLSVTELREVISGLQELIGSESELQGIVDTEYFMAVRRLESQGLDQETLTKEQDALATRFLAVRPLFADPKAAELGFTSKVEEPTGKLAREWAAKNDFLPVLARSRLVSTQRAALEILAGLEAYKKEKKAYPDKVDDLKPAYLSRIPTDWFSTDGRFVYTKTEKGFKLESVSPSLPEAKGGRVTW